MNDRHAEIKKNIIAMICDLRKEHEKDLAPLLEVLWDMETGSRLVRDVLGYDDPEFELIIPANDRHCCQRCPALFSFCRDRPDIKNGPVIKKLRADLCRRIKKY